MKQFDKKKEKNYDYWQNIFDGHYDYMMSGKDNEYYLLREEFIKYLKDGDKVLDVGAASGGTYQHLKEFVDKKIDYKGTDYASNFIKANKERFPEAKWEIQDARYLKEADESYDAVIMYDVLDSMEGWELALDEAMRVSKKWIFILMWTDNNMDDKYNYLKDKGWKTRMYQIDHYIRGHRIIIAKKPI